MKISKIGRVSLAITILVAILATVIGVSAASAATVCSPATAITVPYAKDGVGDVCLQATSLCSYVNSWNLTTLEINGTSYLNTYVAGSSIAPLNGGYTIHYVSTVAWGHFEIGAPCTTGPTNTPITGNTATRTSTLTNTPVISITPAFTSTRTKTVTAGPSFTATRTITKTTTAPFTPARTNTPTITPTKTPTALITACAGCVVHLPNPFLNGKWYVNHDWQGSATYSNVGTFVWMDSIAAVNGTGAYTRSLTGHLDLALAQGATLFGIVIYDLPNRDCSALSSNGELLIANDGSTRYRNEYVNVIAGILSQAKYSTLRIIAVIEPDSLPNLITNTSIAKCQEATNAVSGYVANTTYTLNKLYLIPNVYSYIDIGHAGWLGWPNNMGPAVTLISNMVKGTTGGVNGIDGFIDNTANTQVETETYLDAATIIGGNPVRSGSYFDWNDYIDESHYAAAWQTAMRAAGLPARSTNMLIDTSRNGWGGCGGGPYALQTCRPTKTSTSTVLDTYINESRIDRRPAKGNWCNQNGAGIGKLPGPGTAPYQYYVWVKPPGESDGSSTLIPVGPDNPDGKGLDGMCDPNYMGNSLNENMNSNALPNAPLSGKWFQAQFDQLVANKFP